MILNFVHIVIMAITFLYMFNKAEFAQTRLVSLVPLTMMLVDVCSIRADFLSVPALAVILAVLRIGVLACCGGAMQADRRLVRARERAKLRNRMMMRTAAIAQTPCLQECMQYA